jgi:undecaprenyl diphosphate synthase
MTANCLCPPKLEFYSVEEMNFLQKSPIPGHVAIIMDGNRRWAKNTFSPLNPLNGHWAGAKAIFKIVQAAQEMGIKVLTVYGFSTENWTRSPEELETLFSVFQTYLKENRQLMIEKGVRLHTIGDLRPFSESLRREVFLTQEATKESKNIDLVVALNYGGRDEIKRAFHRLLNDFNRKKVTFEDITEELISKYLDTSPWGDPELLIRTSGEMRISNFLLWQLAYCEIYVTDVLWPDFTPKELLQAVRAFQNRERRQGR